MTLIYYHVAKLYAASKKATSSSTMLRERRRQTASCAVYQAALALACGQLAWQAWRVDLDDPADCLDKFRSNTVFGWLMLAAILLGRLSG